MKIRFHESVFKYLAAFIICFLGILIYSNTFDCSFHFDGYSTIIKNPAIHNIGNLKAIWDFYPTRFIGFLSFALNYHFNQTRVFGYHLVNLLIHLGSSFSVAILILLTFSILTNDNKKIVKYNWLASFFGGLVFLVHPIQTESVTYIYQRLTSLATLCYLASLIFYIMARLLQPARENSLRFNAYLASIVIGVVGVLTKEIVTTLPLIILIYEFYFLRRKKSFEWKYIVPFLAIAMAIPILLLILKDTPSFEIKKLIENPIYCLTSNLYTQLRVRVTYLRLFFIPINQNLLYDYPTAKTLWEVPIMASLFLLILVLGIAITVFKKNKLISFGIAWIYISLLPESSIVPLKNTIFEHRLYLPMVGYSFFIAACLWYFANKKKKILPVAVTVLSIVSVWYSILTYNRNYVWKDDWTLWSDTISKSPRIPGSYMNRGNFYYEKGNYDAAIVDYVHALRLAPSDANLYLNLGNAYLCKEEYEKAISFYDKVLFLRPNYAEAYSNRSVAHQKKGDYEKAISDCSWALNIDPYYVGAYLNRAIAYAFKHDRRNAINDIKKIQDLGYQIDVEDLRTIWKIFKKYN